MKSVNISDNGTKFFIPAFEIWPNQQGPSHKVLYHIQVYQSRKPLDCADIGPLLQHISQHLLDYLRDQMFVVRWFGILDRSNRIVVRK